MVARVQFLSDSLTTISFILRTVLLLNPSEIQSDFLSIAEKLSGTEQQQHSTVVTLIEHVYQANFGNQYDLSSLCQVLKVE